MAGGSCSTLDIGPGTFNLSLVFVKIKVVKRVKKNIVSLKYFVKFGLFSFFLIIVNLVNMLYTLNFRQISQYLSQFLKYKNSRPHFRNFKTRTFDATQLIGGKVMFTRF